jgi:hypothetical protein
LWQVAWFAKPFHVLTSVTAKHMTCLCILVYLAAEIGVVELLYLCMTNVWHKIICKGLAEFFLKTYWYLSKLLKVELHQVTSTNTQNKLHFAYLLRNCWNSEKLNLKLLNLFFFLNE